MNKEVIAKFRAGAKLPVTAMRSGSSASAHLLDGNLRISEEGCQAFRR